MYTLYSQFLLKPTEKGGKASRMLKHPFFIIIIIIFFFAQKISFIVGNK